MDRHTCKQCGKVYNYCRSCVLSPIPWRAAGFCSRECSAEFKKPKIEEVIPVEDVEVIKPDEDTSTSEEEIVEYPHFFDITESTNTPKKKRNKRSIKENDIDDNEQSDTQDI